MPETHYALPCELKLRKIVASSVSITAAFHCSILDCLCARPCGGLGRTSLPRACAIHESRTSVGKWVWLGLFRVASARVGLEYIGCASAVPAEREFSDLRLKTLLSFENERQMYAAFSECAVC